MLETCIEQDMVIGILPVTFLTTTNTEKVTGCANVDFLEKKLIHITSEQCPIYSDIREKYSDFSKDEDLVSYFDEVLERRDLIEAMEQDERDYTI